MEAVLGMATAKGKGSTPLLSARRPRQMSLLTLLHARQAPMPDAGPCRAAGLPVGHQWQPLATVPQARLWLPEHLAPPPQPGQPTEQQHQG